MKLFTVVYTINGRTTVSKSHTPEGVIQIMNTVIRCGGSGYALEQSITEIAPAR